MFPTLPRFRPGMAAKAGLLAVTAALAIQSGESRAAEAEPAPGDFIDCLVSEIIAGTCNGGDITVGDKTLTGFDFSGMFVDAGDRMIFTQVTDFEYQFQYNFSPAQRSNSSGSFFYTVSVNPIGLAQGNEFWKAQSNITGSILNPPGFFTTTVTTNPAINPMTSGSSPQINPSSNSFFGSGVTSAVFTQAFQVGGGNNNALANSMGVTLTQRRPKNEVPGPLPILGAGVAFGLSRKLRQRVRQAA
mgnify:CR=1 FL=1